jgi:RNA polymerase sigma-70 factor, ECF subfamily
MMAGVPFVMPASTPASMGEGDPRPNGAGEISPAVAELLMKRHRVGVYTFLRRRGFTAEEADDLTQETLIRAYTHLDGFRGLSMAAWLHRIAANISVDYLRKQRVSTVPLESLPVADEEEDPVTRLDRQERCARVLSVIQDLPECHQRVIRLRYYENRSLAEIAEAVHCTPMAAKLRVFRAVTALRKRWRSLALDSDLLRD